MEIVQKPSNSVYYEWMLCYVILIPSNFHILTQITGLKLCHLWDRSVTSVTVLMVKRGNKTKVWRKKGKGWRMKTWNKLCPTEFQWYFQLLWEFCFPCSLTMLSALNNVRSQDDRSIMKRNGFGRKWLWCRGTILTSAWRYRKPWKVSVRTASVPAGIWTRHLLNRSPDPKETCLAV
jgi:hypothetical protein